MRKKQYKNALPANYAKENHMEKATHTNSKQKGLEWTFEHWTSLLGG